MSSAKELIESVASGKDVKKVLEANAVDPENFDKAQRDLYAKVNDVVSKLEKQYPGLKRYVAWSGSPTKEKAVLQVILYSD